MTEQVKLLSITVTGDAQTTTTIGAHVEQGLERKPLVLSPRNFVPLSPSGSPTCGSHLQLVDVAIDTRGLKRIVRKYLRDKQLVKGLRSWREELEGSLLKEQEGASYSVVERKFNSVSGWLTAYQDVSETEIARVELKALDVPVNIYEKLCKCEEILSEYKAAKTDNTEMKQLLEQLQEYSHLVDVQNDSIVNNCNWIAKENNELLERIEEFERDESIYKHRITDLEENRTLLLLDLFDLENNLEDVNIDKAYLECVEDKNKQDFKLLQESYEELDEDFHRVGLISGKRLGKIRHLNSQVEKLRRHLEQAKDTLMIEEIHTQAYESKYDQSLDELEAQKTHNVELEQALEIQKHLLDGEQSTVSALCKEMESLNRRSQEQTVRVVELESTSIKQELDIDMLKEEIDELDTIGAKQEFENVALEQEVNESINEIKALEQEIDRLNEKRLHRRINEQKRENEQLTQQNDQFRQQNEQLQRDNDQLKQQIDNLNVNNMKQQMDIEGLLHDLETEKTLKNRYIEWSQMIQTCYEEEQERVAQWQARFKDNEKQLEYCQRNHNPFSPFGRDLMDNNNDGSPWSFREDGFWVPGDEERGREDQDHVAAFNSIFDL